MSLIRFTEGAIPTDNPSANRFYIGIDSADGQLYLKDSAGAITKYATDDLVQQNKLDGSVAPTSTNDSSEGYAKGSLWIDDVANEAYRCVDATVSSAIWINTTLEVGELATVALSGDYTDLSNQPTTITAGQASEIIANNAKITYPSADSTKLSGIATGATANNTDAFLIDRSNHTGTQTASTVSDFDTEVSNNVDVTANTAKVGITPTQASDITANNAKVTYPTADSDKLAGIEALATKDQTDAEIETAYNNQVAIVSQVNAEAGTSTTPERWTPQRVKQAIDALAPAGGSTTETIAISLTSAIVSGSATSGFLASTNNMIEYEILGGGGGASKIVYYEFIVPANYSSGGTIKINTWTTDFTNLTTWTVTAYINGTVDATVNAIDITPTADTTYQLKSNSFGSALTAGDVLMVKLNFTGSNFDDVRTNKIEIEYTA